MGCRFCMLSCPFDIPKFEYDSANPRISKCNMCYEKTIKGELPTCVEACPAEAIVFGTRRELMEVARKRIYENPDDYNHQVYGEHVAGGTGMLYLASSSFGDLGFDKKIGNESYPELTTDFLYSVPVIETLLPAFLIGLSFATKRKNSIEKKSRENEHENE